MKKKLEKETINPKAKNQKDVCVPGLFGKSICVYFDQFKWSNPVNELVGEMGKHIYFTYFIRFIHFTHFFIKMHYNQTSISSIFISNVLS